MWLVEETENLQHLPSFSTNETNVIIQKDQDAQQDI